MLNHIKINPAVFLGEVETVYIFGWVLTGYLFSYPQNGRFFLTLCPERFHFLPSRLALAFKMRNSLHPSENRGGAIPAAIRPCADRR